MATSLLGLSLVCWNLESMGYILSSFGVLVRASKLSTSRKDLTSFDISFLYEDTNSLPWIIKVIVGLNKFEVKLQVNYNSPFNSSSETNPSQDNNDITIDEDDKEFWLGAVDQRFKNFSRGNCSATHTTGSSKRKLQQPHVGQSSPSLSSAS